MLSKSISKINRFVLISSSSSELVLRTSWIKYSSLDSTIAETSGLIYLDRRIWTINDSGREAAIYHDGIISLSYDEAVVRNNKGFYSHDCEALFAHVDSLYLFSKDWWR